MHRRPTVPALLLALLLAFLLTGCGTSAGEPAGGETESPAPSADGPVEVSEVRHDLTYYDPCRNEVYPIDGVTYYPLYSEELGGLDESRYPVPERPDTATSGGRGLWGAGAGMAVIPMVPMPQEGDDTGTMILYADGMARFESHTGIVSWLSTESRDYGWVC